MKSIKISIEDKETFELTVDGDITSISIETTKGEYIINKTKNIKSKPTFTENEIENMTEILINMFK